MKDEMDLRLRLTILFIDALQQIGNYIPALDRKAHAISAREVFRRVSNTDYSLDDPALRELDLRHVKKAIANAGYDTEKDQGYFEILGLKGGKVEFDRFPHVMIAKELFFNGVSGSSQEEVTQKLKNLIEPIKEQLRLAGYDPESNTPYQEVLQLEGLQDFISLMNREYKTQAACVPNSP